MRNKLSFIICWVLFCISTNSLNAQVESSNEIITMSDPYTKELINFRQIRQSDADFVDGNRKADGVIYLQRNGNLYKRAFSGAVNIKWFGARGDGKTNDTKAFQSAINSYNPIMIDPGVYLIDSIIVPYGFGGLTIQGSGYSNFSAAKSTVLKSHSASNMFVFKNGADWIKMSNLRLDGNHIGKKGIEGTFGAGLILENLGVYNFTEFGAVSRQGLWRVDKCFFGDNKVGIELYSDATVSNSEFTGGDKCIRIVAGGDRLYNVWANGAHKVCLELQPLNEKTGLQNTSITNFYAGDIKNSYPLSQPVINIRGNDIKRVQQVQISNSYLVNAVKNNSIVGFIRLNKADEVMISNVNILGMGLYAEAKQYTDYFVYGEDASRVVINGNIIDGTNKNAVHMGLGCYDWSISNNMFINCGDKIAKGDEGANIYIKQENSRALINGNTFLVASGSAVPYAVYSTTSTSLSFNNNYINYPSPVHVKTKNAVNEFSGSYFVSGNNAQTERQKQPLQGIFESGLKRPDNPKVGQYFYDKVSSKLIIWNGSVWKDTLGNTIK